MRFFEDFSVRERIETRGRTITEADIVNFAAFSGDWYPLHVGIDVKNQRGEDAAVSVLKVLLKKKGG